MVHQTLTTILFRSLTAVVLLATVTKSSAGNMIYDILDYPADDSDLWVVGTTDTISGTIITDGHIGTLAASDIVGGSWTYTNPVYGSFTNPVAGHVSILGEVVASPSAITLAGPPSVIGDENRLELSAGLYPNSDLRWFRFFDQFFGYSSYHDGQIAYNGEPPFTAFSVYDNSTPGQSLILGGQDPWIIATAVPEPTALSLLGTALIGLGVFYLRRRVAKG